MLSVHILTVGIVDLALLQRGKVEEVRGPVNLVVELFRVGQLQVIFHVGVMANTCRGRKKKGKKLGEKWHHSRTKTLSISA